MKAIKIFLFSFFILTTVHAQFVTVPDSMFRVRIQSSPFYSCISGTQLDTLCVQNLTASGNYWLNIAYSSIQSIEGIQYFSGLTRLDCSGNSIDTFPVLPASIDTIFCQQNSALYFTSLPANLKFFQGGNNSFTTLPPLPANLEYLDCGANNYLNLIPTLPNGLISLISDGAHVLTNLPALPPSLRTLQCTECNLSSLPDLPDSLTTLFCPQNFLTTLPTLPNSLELMEVGQNQLTELPNWPANLVNLFAADNQLHCIPQVPDSVAGIDFQNNPLYCWPNNPSIYLGPFNPFPGLCLPNNVNGCDIHTNISGFVYRDSINNCYKDSAESFKSNIKVDLYQNGVLSDLMFSYYQGGYGFFTDSGTYEVIFDTLNKPYVPICIYPGIDSVVNIPFPNSQVFDVNFDVECKPGFDIGIWSMTHVGPSFFPGSMREIKVFAGDYSLRYGLDCSNGVSGELSIYVTGPVNFFNPAIGSNTPTYISTDTLRYTIPDFGLINPINDFRLNFLTDTMATVGDTVCFHIEMTPVAGDNAPFNNSFDYCVPVINSYDPNIKEVSPIGDVIYPYSDWLTYTIYFQNTGNAAAINIRLIDTLDTDLDLSTFEVLSYSDPVKVYVYNNIGVFKFNDIMLPDSSSDPEGSIGYIQYRIKPQGVKPIGTVFENTTYIYFDYNSPIITNTTETEIVASTTGIENTPIEQELILYPNPSNNYIYISGSKSGNECFIYNSFGQQVLRTIIANSPINVEPFSSGIYFVEIKDMLSGVKVIKKLIIQ